MNVYCPECGKKVCQHAAKCTYKNTRTFCTTCNEKDTCYDLKNSGYIETEDMCPPVSCSAYTKRAPVA